MFRLIKVIVSVSSVLAMAAGGVFALPQQAQAANSGGEQPVYRLYSSVSAEHLYTTDAHEVAVLQRNGWGYEGVAWVSPKKSGTPVYRLYSPVTGDHHYTIELNERNVLTRQGWRNEGIAWYSDDLHTIKIWRQYSPALRVGSHHYTSDENEYRVNNSRGWQGEGIAWYALKPGWSDPTPTPPSTVTPQAPDVIDKTGEDDDTVMIPSSVGVEYYVNGVKAAAGTHPASKFAPYTLGEDNFRHATIEIIAKELPGYQIKGTYRWEWTIPGNYVPPVTPTPTPTTTPSPKPSTTPKPTPSATPSTTPKPTPTPSSTPSTTPKPTPTPTVTPTPTPQKVKAQQPEYGHKDGKADTITIPNVTGVQYTISGNKKTQAVAPGTYNVSDFSTYPEYSAYMEITATAKDGYDLLNDDGSSIASKTYKVTFSGTTSVSAEKPNFEDKSGKDNDAFTIPSVGGVNYYIGTKNLGPGTYKVSDYATYTNHKATVKIEAKPKDGYTLSGFSSWSKDFSDLIEVTAVQPEVSGDVIMIPIIEGLRYFVNGSPVVSGSTYKPADSDYVNGVANIEMSAEAKDGYLLTNWAHWTVKFRK